MKLSYFIIIIIIAAIINPVWSRTEVSGNYESSSLGSYFGRGQDSAKGGQSQQHASEDVASPRESYNERPTGQTPSRETTFLGDNSIAINLIYPKHNLHISDFALVGVEVLNKANHSITFNLIESIDRSLAAFYPSVNGYTLPDDKWIMYYEQNFLEYLECGKNSLRSYDSSIDYDEVNRCLANHNQKSIDKQDLQDVQRFLNKPPIFEWDHVKNGSLKDYINLSNFIEYRLQALIDREIDTAKVYRYNDRISIYIGNKSIIEIIKNNDTRDSGYSILSYNNLTFHLKMHEGAVYDIGDILYFKDITLNRGQMFVFWCYIKPLSTGLFDASTYVIVNNPRHIILNSAPINVENNPNFRVTRTFSKYQNLLNDELDMAFDIVYLGGGTEPEIKYVKVFFDKSHEYEYISLNGTKCTDDMKKNPMIEENFTKNVSKIIKVKIGLNTTGVISPPGLKINGNYKPFYDTITVDRPVARYFNYISLFFTILSFIIIFLFKDVCLDSSTDCGDQAKTYKQILGKRLVDWIKKRSKSDLIKGTIIIMSGLLILALLIALIIVPILDIIIRLLVYCSSI